MKKIAIILLFLFALSVGYAQSGNGMHEVSGGIGRLSGRDLFFTLSYVSTTYDIHIEYRLIYAAGYKYYVSNDIAPGIVVAQHSFEKSFTEALIAPHHRNSFWSI